MASKLRLVGLAAICALFSILLQNCSDSRATALTKSTSVSYQIFNDYWYAGKAELNSYSLEQARYGEIRQGEAMLVFVTEDFRASTQVKADDLSKKPEELQKVLKLNATRNFLTGVYPYSMMLSVFSDLEEGKGLVKATASAQEWCGHTFTQINSMKKDLRFRQFSYFESEGDVDLRLPKALFEDELFNQIRINPRHLPSGQIMIYPSLLYSRFKHIEVKPYAAKVAIHETTKQGVKQLVLNYLKIDRELKIDFEERFPHRIFGWQEEYLSGFGADAIKMKTKANLKQTLISDYWNHNSNADRNLRDKLQLD